MFIVIHLLDSHIHTCRTVVRTSQVSQSVETNSSTNILMFRVGRGPITNVLNHFPLEFCVELHFSLYRSDSRMKSFGYLSNGMYQSEEVHKSVLAK